MSERGVTLTSTPVDRAEVRLPDDDMMVSDKLAAEVAAINRHRLRYWEKTDLIKPDVGREISPRNIVRLYSLPRLVELGAASDLRLAGSPWVFGGS